MMNNKRLQEAVKHAGVEAATFLGEGAWHYAWKVSKNKNEFVLRIPKEIAYGKRVHFSEKELKAEYGGTELYYRSVNKAVAGAAPEFFEFHVSRELTYTLESFGGQQIDLHNMTEETAYRTGKAIGEIHRKTENIPHELNGFGYLSWSETKGLHGSISGDAREFLKEESEEHLADYQVLCQAKPMFDDKTVSQTLQLAVDLRKRTFTKPLLANQDASPENILLNGDRVCLIDPFPSIYYPRGLAGNFMNLYETFFIALADTDRYRKHRFSACANKLKRVAKGFIDGYSDLNAQVAAEVRGEQLLQLLDTAYNHVQMLSEDLPEEARIRYGNKKEIEDRLIMLSEELKALAASEMGNLAHFSASEKTFGA